MCVCVGWGVVCGCVHVCVSLCVYLNQEPAVFSPESVRPYPKASPRKANRQQRKKKTSTILTDTPEKQPLEEEKKASSLKVKRKIIETKEGGKRRKKTNSDTQCLVCAEWFSASKPGEKWVSCCGCGLWSHFECTTGDKQYVCHHCEE